MLELLASLDGTPLAKWMRLAITLAPVLYLSVLNQQRLEFKVSLLIKAGLFLLTVRAVLDLATSYSQLDSFPIIGGGDPLHGFYQNILGGIAGLATLVTGLCLESYHYVKTRGELDRDRRVMQSVLSLLKAGVLVRDAEQRVVYLNPTAAEALQGHRAFGGQVATEEPAGVAGPQGMAATCGPVFYRDSKTFQTAEAELSEAPQEQKLTVQAWWDVTEWERGQRLSHEFVSTVSHEFRTPLTSIKGFMELAMRDSDMGAKARGYLEVVQSNTNRLISVVDDLLSLSRIEAGCVTVNCNDLAIGPLVQEAIRNSEEAIRTSGVRVMIDAPEDRLFVHADRERLHQVVANLLSNACKYTPEGGSVHIRMRATNSMVAIDFEDTGMGIPEAEQGQMFTRFFRSTDARLRRISGSGLGLVITKSLVEAMGGTISFVSIHGKGSTFTVTIPRAQQVPEPAGRATQQGLSAA